MSAEDRLAKLEQDFGLTPDPEATVEDRLMKLEGAGDEQQQRRDAEHRIKMEDMANAFSHVQLSAPTIDADALGNAFAMAMRHMPNSANLPSPPTYSGENDALDWNTFLDQFDRCMELNGWDVLSTEHQAKILQSSLKAGAANAFSTLSLTDKSSYKRAVDSLTKIFVNPAKVTLYQNQFEGRVQQKDEERGSTKTCWASVPWD